MHDTHHFGTQEPSTEYQERNGAYGVVHRDGAILIETAPLGYFLPGGGIDDGETPEEALRREFKEETGFELANFTKIGVATEYIPHRGQPGVALKKICHFYVVELGESGAPTHPDGDDHTIEWIPLDRIRERMFLESYLWAIEQVTGRP